MDCNSQISTADLFNGVLGKDVNGIIGIDYKEVAFDSALPCGNSLGYADVLKNVFDYDSTCGKLVLRIVLGTSDCSSQCSNEYQGQGIDLIHGAIVMATDGLPALYLLKVN